MSDRQSFTIESFEVKQTKGDDPKTYGRVKASGLGWVSIWGQSDRDFAAAHVGQNVSAKIVLKGDFKNAEEFSESTTGTHAAGSSEQMSKEEWDHKEDRQRIGILYAVHLKQMFEWNKLGIETDDPTKAIFTSYNDLAGHARKAAVADLDWIRKYATGDVPL